MRVFHLATERSRLEDLVEDAAAVLFRLSGKRISNN